MVLLYLTMTVSILIVSFCLVLVGLLFGFNIQVDESIISIFSSVSSLIAAFAAAAAAYFSYMSIGQWRKQSEHSLLYEHLSDLENLLLAFLEEFKEKAFDENINKVLDVIQIPASAARNVRPEYEKVYNKIKGLIVSSKQDDLEEIELSALLLKLHEPLLKLKSTKNRIDRFCKEHPETNENSLDEFPELQENMRLMLQYSIDITNICEQATTVLRSLRSSL